LIVIIIIKCVY